MKTESVTTFSLITTTPLRLPVWLSNLRAFNKFGVLERFMFDLDFEIKYGRKKGR